MKIGFSAPAMPRAGAIIVGVMDGGDFTPMAERLDKATDGALRRAMDASRFTGKRNQTLTVIAPAGTLGHWREIATIRYADNRAFLCRAHC